MANPASLFERIPNPILQGDTSSVSSNQRTVQASFHENEHFLPEETPEDKFILEFYKQGFLDEEGIVKDEYKNLPFPDLEFEEFESFCIWLSQQITISNKKSGKDYWEASANLDKIFEDILSELRKSTNVKYFELFGSTVPYILGISFLRKAFKSIHLQNVDAIISSELCSEITQEPEDFDTRFKASKKDTRVNLYGFKDTVIKVISEHVGQTEKIVFGEALDKYETIPFKNNKYSIVSTGDHKTKTVEFQLFTELQRKKLFFRDALRFIFYINKQGKDSVRLACDVENRWQVLIDQLGKVIDDDELESINKYGWITALSLITRGKTCRKPAFLQKLYERFKSELIEENIKINSKELLAREIESIFFKSAFAHHRNDPCGTFCFALNTVYFLHEVDPELAKIVLRKILNSNKFANIPPDSKNSSEKILSQIYSILKQDTGALETIFSLLQIQSFIALTFKQSKQTENSPKFVIRKHCLRPAAEMQFSTDKKNCSLLFPIQPEATYDLLFEKWKGRPEYISLLEDLLCCVPSEYGPSGSQNTIQKYQSHLNMDVNSLIKKILINATNPADPLLSLNYSLLNACYRIQPAEFLLQQIVQLMPIAISRTDMASLQAICVRDIAHNFQNSEWPLAIVEPISEMIEDRITGAQQLIKKWLEQIGINPKQNHLARQFLTTYKAYLTKEEYWQLHSHVLSVTLSTNPSMALGLFTSLLQHNGEKQIKTDSWKTLLDIFHSFQMQQPNQLVSYIPVLADLAARLAQDSEAINEVFSDKKWKGFLGAFLKELALHAIPATSTLLTHLRNAKAFSNIEMEGLWVALCNAMLTQNGGNAAFDMWTFGEKNGLLVENSWPMKKKKSLGNIVCKVIKEPGVSEEAISRLFYISIKNLQGFKKLGEIASIYLRTKLCETNLLDLKVHLKALSSIITAEDHFELKRKILIREIGQIEWNNILDRWEELLGGNNAVSLKEKIAELSNVIISSIIKTKFRDKETALRIVCRSGNILLSNAFEKIFLDDVRTYFEFLKQVTLALMKSSEQKNEQLLNELIQKIISLVNRSESKKIDKKNIVTFVVSILERDSRVFGLSDTLRAILQDSQIAWMELLQEEKPSSSILRLNRVYQLHKLPFVVTNSLLEEMSKFLKSSHISEEEIIEIYRFQYHLSNMGQSNLSCPIMIGFHTALIGALIKCTDKGTAFSVIKSFADFSEAQSVLWVKEFSDQFIKWARHIRKNNFRNSLEVLKILEQKDSSAVNEVANELLAYLKSATAEEAKVILHESYELLSQPKFIEVSSNAVKKLILEIEDQNKIHSKDLLILIGLLEKYSIAHQACWLKIMSLSSYSDNISLLSIAWNLLNKNVLQTPFYVDNAEFYSKCWLSGMKILHKIDPEEFSKYFYQCDIIHGFIQNWDARIEFYDQLTQFTISLRQHPEQINFLRFLKDKNFLSQLASHGKTVTALLGLMILIRKGASSDVFDIYSRSVQDVAEIFYEIKSHISNDELNEILQLFVKNSIKFPLVPELISVLAKSKNVSKFSIIPLLSYITHHRDLELNLLVLVMINGWLSQKSLHKINEEQRTNLTAFLTTALGDARYDTALSSRNVFNKEYSPKIVDEIAQIFGHKHLEIMLGTENLRQIQISVSMAANLQRISCPESQTLEFHQAILHFFIKSFPFVISRGDIDYEKFYVSSYFHDAVVSVHLFDTDELLRYFLNEFVENTSTGGKFKIPPNRIFKYFKIMIEDLFKVEAHSLKLDEVPKEVSESTKKDLSQAVKTILQIMLRCFPDDSLETFLWLPEYIFYKTTFHKNCYDNHVNNCKEIFKGHLNFIKGYGTVYFGNEDKKSTILQAFFICHLLIPFEEETQIPNLAKLLTDGFQDCPKYIDICSKFNHPAPLWHLISQMPALAKIESKNKATILLECYEMVFKAISPYFDEEKPEMLFEKDGIPLYAHFIDNFLKIEGLKSHPRAIDLFEECIKKVLLLHNNLDNMPKSIGKRYDPADYMVNTLFISFLGGYFKDHYEKYLEILALLMFMKEDARNKYAKFVIDKMLKVPHGVVLTEEDGVLRDSLLEFWSKVVSGEF